MSTKTVVAEHDCVTSGDTVGECRTSETGIDAGRREQILAAAAAHANAAPIQVTPEVTRRLSELLGVALNLPQ